MPDWISEAHSRDAETPLDPDEAAELKATWIATRLELNAMEQESIAVALAHPRWRRFTTLDLLDDHTLRRLHKEMFGEVWRWAGRYRSTEKSIGIAPEEISVAVRDLTNDAKYWFRSASAEDMDLAAVTFHHRLVLIHPFVNGNGRHARAATDLILRSLEQAEFTWGSRGDAIRARENYLRSLREADKGDFDALRQFVRS